MYRERGSLVQLVAPNTRIFPNLDAWLHDMKIA
jgi:hypothetical protein